MRSIPFLGFFSRILGRLFTSLDEGGFGPVWGASAKKVREESEVYKGAFLFPIGKLRKITEDGKDERLAKELWETSEEVLKELGV